MVFGYFKLPLNVSEAMQTACWSEFKGWFMEKGCISGISVWQKDVGKCY